MLLILFTAHITSATAETYLSLSIKPKKKPKKNSNKNQQARPDSITVTTH